MVGDIATTSTRWWSIVVVAPAVLCFIIYLGLVLTLPQIRNGVYCCEFDDFAAGVSNIIYGSPIGTIDRNVYNYVRSDSTKPLTTILDNLSKLRDDHSPLKSPGRLATTTDGNGVGYILVATAAFHLFGLHAWAPIVGMLVLMGLSSVLFISRFGRAFLFVITLYFTTLIGMLSSILLWDSNVAEQYHVAGIRYFSLVAVVPIFHIYLDLTDGQAHDTARSKNYYWALSGQAVVLTFALLVRASMSLVVGAIFVVGLAMAYQHRNDKERLRLLRRKSSVIGVSVLSVIALAALSLPQYVWEGKFTTVFWHRAVISLGANPDFPFSGLDGMFRCGDLPPEFEAPRGLEPGIVDRNGQCIWGNERGIII